LHNDQEDQEELVVQEELAADHKVVLHIELVAHQVVHQVKVDLIVQDNDQVLAVAEILQVHSVRVDQRRAVIKRVRKLCVMISKTCKHLHSVA